MTLAVTDVVLFFLYFGTALFWLNRRRRVSGPPWSTRGRWATSQTVATPWILVTPALRSIQRSAGRHPDSPNLHGQAATLVQPGTPVGRGAVPVCLHKDVQCLRRRLLHGGLGVAAVVCMLFGTVGILRRHAADGLLLLVFAAGCMALLVRNLHRQTGSPVG